MRHRGGKTAGCLWGNHGVPGKRAWQAGVNKPPPTGLIQPTATSYRWFYIFKVFLKTKEHMAEPASGPSEEMRAEPGLERGRAWWERAASPSGGRALSSDRIPGTLSSQVSRAEQDVSPGQR